jgi:poly(A) polymerase/tRNA nucleotidyltransferase (CCA-adding enzyme)
VKSIGRILGEAGYQCFLVGGAVRNLVMKSAPKDYDLATDARPEEVQRLFRRVIPTGIDHGTVTVVFKGENYEVTTFRTEAEYSDGRHPDAVHFETDIDADLSRRDFTMNGMAIDVATGQLHDPFGGKRDIQARVVRAIGDPATRLREDGLRIMRAFRFAAQLEFEIHEETYGALVEVREGVTGVAVERVRDELIRMLESRKPSVGLSLMHQSGTLSLVLPELDRCAGTPQEGAVVTDLLEHLLLACDGAPAEHLEVRIAALLHDIGKPDTKGEREDGSIHFHGHDELSAQMCENILTRLRFPTRTVRYVTRLVAAHMQHYTSQWSDAAVRRFVHRVGPDAVWDLIALQRADAYGKIGRPPQRSPVDELSDRVSAVLQEEAALSLRDLAVNGRDLQQEADIPAGPALGQVLDFLLQTVLDDPEQNERETLLRIGRNYYDSRIRVPDGME